MAQEDDFDAVRDLWAALNAEVARPPYGPTCFDELWPVARALFDANLVLVAEREGAVAGCVIATRVRTGLAYVSGMYLRPELRGRGVGRRLLEALALVLRERGIAHLLLDVDAGNDRAVAFYEHVGFRDAGRRLTIQVDRLLPD